MFCLCELFKDECSTLGTVFFLQDPGPDLRLHHSVSWYHWDIDLPRGQNRLPGGLSVTFPPGTEPQSCAPHKYSWRWRAVSLIRGHPSSHPPSRTGYCAFLFVGFHHPNLIPLFCPGGTHR